MREAHIDISVVPVLVTLNLQFPPGRLKDSQEPAGMGNVSLLCWCPNQSVHNSLLPDDTLRRLSTHSLANPSARVWQSSMVGATLSATMQNPSAIRDIELVLSSVFLNLQYTQLTFAKADIGYLAALQSCAAQPRHDGCVAADYARKSDDGELREELHALLRGLYRWVRVLWRLVVLLRCRTKLADFDSFIPHCQDRFSTCHLVRCTHLYSVVLCAGACTRNSTTLRRLDPKGSLP